MKYTLQTRARRAMIAMPMAQLNPHALESKALFPSDEYTRDVRSLVDEVINDKPLARILQGTAVDNPDFKRKLRTDLKEGQLNAKLLFKQYEPVADGDVTSDCVPLSGDLDHSWVRPLTDREMKQSAQLVITLNTRHPKYPEAKPSIRLSMVGNDKLKLEARPVAGPWQDFEVVADDCDKLKERVFDVDTNRKVFSTGFDSLTPMFTSVCKWNPLQHVVCDIESGWSLMPHFLSKAFVFVVSTYLRPQIVGIAAMGGDDAGVTRDLVAERVSFRAQSHANAQRAVLSMDVHRNNGACWCGVHPRCCSEEAPIDTPVDTHVKIDLMCCGRRAERVDNLFICPCHNKTTNVYQPNGNAPVVCMEDMSVVVKCVHSEQQSLEDIAARRQSKRWTETRFAIHLNHTEQVLLGHIINSAVNVYTFLSRAVTVSEEDYPEDEIVKYIGQHMSREARLLHEALCTPTPGSSSVTTDTEEVDEFEELGEDVLYTHDTEVIELVRSGKLWLELKSGQIYKGAGVRPKYRNPKKLAKLRQVPDLMARIVTSGTLKKYKVGKRGAAGAEKAKLPAVYRRLVPVKVF